MEQAGQWIEFEVHHRLTAKAFVVNGKVEKVKLSGGVPRQYYYTCLNDAMLEAEELERNGFFTYKIQELNNKQNEHKKEATGDGGSES